MFFQFVNHSISTKIDFMLIFSNVNPDSFVIAVLRNKRNNSTGLLLAQVLLQEVILYHHCKYQNARFPLGGHNSLQDLRVLFLCHHP